MIGRSYCDQKLRLWWSECDCWVEFFIVNCAKPSDGSIMIQFFHLRLWFRFVISYLICHQVQKCLNLFTWQHDKFPFNALMNKIVGTIPIHNFISFLSANGFLYLVKPLLYVLNNLIKLVKEKLPPWFQPQGLKGVTIDRTIFI